jgi:hypothetical protein
MLILFVCVCMIVYNCVCSCVCVLLGRRVSILYWPPWPTVSGMLTSWFDSLLLLPRPSSDSIGLIG